MFGIIKPMGISKMCIFKPKLQSLCIHFFGKYYRVPEAMRAEVNSFASAVMALGESSADAGAFEADVPRAAQGGSIPGW